MDHDLIESAQETAEPAAGVAAAPGRDRRALLRTAGIGAAAVAVGLTAAACTTASAANDPAGAGADTANPAPTGDSTLGPTTAIPVGGGVIYQDAKVVVTQPTAGEYKAFSAVCTHMQCLVGSVSNNVIECPCHGSEYSALTGAVQRGPATQGLPATTVTVVDGQVVLS